MTMSAIFDVLGVSNVLHSATEGMFFDKNKIIIIFFISKI